MNRAIRLQFTDLTRKSFSFKTISELVNFLESEIDFWSERIEDAKKDQSKMHPALLFLESFKDSLNTINSWSDQINDWDEAQLQRQISHLDQTIFRHASVNYLWSGHPFIDQFVSYNFKYGKQTATAFLDYVTKRHISNLNQPGEFLGVMLAYEFIFQDTELLKRRKSEQHSLDHLREVLAKTTKNLVSETEEIKDAFHNWDENTRNTWSTWLDNASENFNDLKNRQNNEFAAYMSNCHSKISELENTYQEKLRLKKPAQYWNTSAKKYGVQGGLWSLSVITSVLLGIVYFSEFFSNWLKGQEMGIQLNTIQGIVIFGTILAVYAFLVRTLSRLTFSSFHLMRDAEEREQLTYLYLSLSNDLEIDERSREIVLQALFSRSETGLLASESGPTMPTASEILRSASKVSR